MSEQTSCKKCGTLFPKVTIFCVAPNGFIYYNWDYPKWQLCELCQLDDIFEEMRENGWMPKYWLANR